MAESHSEDVGAELRMAAAGFREARGAQCIGCTTLSLCERGLDAKADALRVAAGVLDFEHLKVKPDQQTVGYFGPFVARTTTELVADYRRATNVVDACSGANPDNTCSLPSGAQLNMQPTGTNLGDPQYLQLLRNASPDQ